MVCASHTEDVRPFARNERVDHFDFPSRFRGLGRRRVTANASSRRIQATRGTSPRTLSISRSNSGLIGSVSRSVRPVLFLGIFLLVPWRIARVSFGLGRPKNFSGGIQKMFVVAEYQNVYLSRYLVP